MSKKFWTLGLILLYSYQLSAIAWAAEYSSSKLVTLNISAADQGSGMGNGAEMMLSQDGQNWCAPEAFAATKSNWDLTAYGGGDGDGVKTVFLKIKDSAGNWSTGQITDSVTLDRIKPAVNAAPPGGAYNITQTVTLTASEAADIYYTTDGSLPTNSSPKYAAPVTLTASTTLKFLAVDLAGNQSEVITETYTNLCVDADGDGYYGQDNCGTPVDCNDNDPNLNLPIVWYRDANGDGYSDGTNIVQCTQPGSDYYPESELIASHGDYCDNIGPASDPRSNFTIYVDAANTGSGDGSPANPYPAIQQAIDAADCGDTIEVNTGVYAENIHFLHKSLNVMGSGGDTVIDGYGSGPAVIFDSGENQYTILNGFTIRNGTGLDIGDGLTAGGGIWVSNGSSPTIVNNIIYSNQATYGGGISCAGSSPIIINNTIVDNLAASGGGISAVNGSFPQVTNTIIWNNANNSIFLYSSAVTVSHSDIEGGYAGNGNIASDPKFMDAAHRDYRLQAGSPCIDTGIANAASATDIAIISRPQGAGYDMGAYEYRNIAPLVTVNAPNGGEVWTGIQYILWTATRQTGTGVLSATLYYGPSASGPWTQIAGGIACASGVQTGYAWDTTPIASSIYYVQVAVLDDTNGMGADVSDAAFRIVKDHTPPAAPVISSATHPDQTGWYNNNAPAFSWTASDESGISGYSYTLNKTATTTPDTVSEGTSATISYTGKSNGTWYFHVRAVDGAGNWGPAGHYRVQIDNSAPVAPRVSSATHPKQMLWYNNNSLVLNWTTPSDLSGISGYSYILNQTPTTIPDTVIDGIANTVSYTSITSGTWYFHVRAADMAGNWGTARHYTIHIAP